MRIELIKRKSLSNEKLAAIKRLRQIIDDFTKVIENDTRILNEYKTYLKRLTEES